MTLDDIVGRHLGQGCSHRDAHHTDGLSMDTQFYGPDYAQYLFKIEEGS